MSLLIPWPQEIFCPSLKESFVSDTSVPQYHTSVGPEPTQVDEYESGSEREFMANEDEEFKDFPVIRHSVKSLKKIWSSNLAHYPLAQRLKKRPRSFTAVKNTCTISTLLVPSVHYGPDIIHHATTSSTHDNEYQMESLRQQF